MKNLIQRLSLATLCTALPCLYGCGSGGGGLADLFSNGSSSATVLASGSSVISGGGSTIATIHNPEPASLLLLGTGLAALALHKRKKN